MWLGPSAASIQEDSSSRQTLRFVIQALYAAPICIVYGMVWYGMVWYGMVWYGTVWYGMVWCGVVFTLYAAPICMVWYLLCMQRRYVWYGVIHPYEKGTWNNAAADNWFHHIRQIRQIQIHGKYESSIDMCQIWWIRYAYMPTQGRPHFVLKLSSCTSDVA